MTLNVSLFAQHKNQLVQEFMWVSYTHRQCAFLFSGCWSGFCHCTTSPAGAVNKTTLTSPSQQEPFRSQVPSVHETIEQFHASLIPKGQLQLVETLGQG